ncbi:hypothetical protein C8R45DRAFT_366944 [Mycena sanguinolenta]|nr:hypothetical protein C8R45DRAFT_366944 [Mycena sanguinolenta]
MEDDSIASVQAIVIQNACHVFSLVLLYYDHLLRIDAEIQYMWKRPRSSGAFIFFYLRCSLHNLLHQILLICTQILISVVMIQRVYALYSSNKQILWGLCGTAITLTGVIIWLVVSKQDTTLLFGLPGCHFDLSRHTSMHLAEAWGALFVFDSLVFCLTIFHAYSTRRRLGPGAHTNMPMYTLIIRDGAIYFGAIALANLANIVTFIVNGPWIPGTLTVFTTSISITMACRLILHLHEQVLADVDPTDFDLSGLKFERTSVRPNESSPDGGRVSLAEV